MVLLVEDDDELRRALERAFRYRGLRVAAFRTASDAALVSRHRRPSAVLTDILLPGGYTGVDLARELQAAYPSVRIVLMTGVSDAELKERGIGLDTLDFPVLRKPFDLDECLPLLSRVPGR